jgi:hypothetical protein
MRAMDIEMRTRDGQPCYFVLGATHAAAFWTTISILTPFVLLVCFFDARRRLLHDMFPGLALLSLIFALFGPLLGLAVVGLFLIGYFVGPQRWLSDLVSGVVVINNPIRAGAIRPARPV